MRPACVERPESLADRALALHAQRQANEAIKLFRQAITLGFESAKLHNDLGNALQDAGDQDAALLSYRQAIAVDETFAPAHQNLGFVQINHGRLEEGRPHLERAGKPVLKTEIRSFLSVTQP